MTSLSNKNAHGAVPRKSMADSDFLEAETIEVVPELPFQDDSDDGYSEFSEDDERADGIAEDEDEPFDEYAYQVSSNHSEPHAIWFDNSQLRSVPLNRSANESDDVILIDDDDGNDNQYNDEKHNGGLLMHNQYEQKFHICEICHSKLSSSYNLKRHMMIHTGEKPFECPICQRRFREQSDLRKHKKVHNTDLILKCSVCHRNPISSRNTMKCADCEKQEELKKIQRAELDAIVPRIDANNRKSFVCKFCERSFGSSSNLKRHVMIHTGEKPFKCSECKRPFREMSTLKKHLITHRKQNGFHLNSVPKERPPPPPKMPILTASLKHTTVEQVSLHKCPLCKTICKGTEGLMNHIMSVHRSKKTDDNRPTITVRKFSKSPPPLIPINRATFKRI